MAGYPGIAAKAAVLYNVLMPRFLRRHATLYASIAIATLVASTAPTLPAALTRPSPYLTRAEAAAIILLSRQDPLPAVPTVHPYADVYADDWFAKPLLAAAELKILSPDPSGTKMKPFGSVSRGSFLKMLTIAFDLPVNRSHTFADVSPFSWYAPYAGTETEYRLFTHADATTLEPDRFLTQDDARAALQRFAERRTAAEEEEARKLSTAQAEGKVQLYGVISTKRLRVVFVPDAATHFAAPTIVPVLHAPSTSSRSAPVGSIPAVRTTPDGIRADVLALVNAARANAGFAPLARNAALETSAQRYAERMVAEGFFGHTAPDGTTLQDRIDAVGYYDRSFSDDCRCVNGYALGENLARGQRSAQEVVTAWMESPSHRDAILGEDFTDMGLGLSAGVWVQHFGGVLTPQR